MLVRCLTPQYEGIRYDVGEKLGFVKTNIEFALQRDDLRDELLEYLKGLASAKQ